MRSKQFVIGACAAVALGAAVVAGCGGGSGGSSALPGPGPNPSPSVGVSPSPVPSPTPTPTPSPVGSPVVLSGGMQVSTGGTVGSGFTYGPAANISAVFSCGCFPQAGIALTDAGGHWSAVSPTQATPGPSPYVLVAGRNYIVIAEPSGGAGPQGWTLLFAGKTPATSLGLGDSNSVLASASMSDNYTTAAALYVYKKSSQCLNHNCETAFDDWNFNAVQAWVTHLTTGPINFAETALLNDIAAQSLAGLSLFPSPKEPTWNPTQPLNTLITSDINAVAGSGDLSIPTPCPLGPASCTGTPTP
ncbi:MAG TPA: hypothetical protein VII69_05070 [Candidatus Eremiobacteraceae bacterium]